MIEHGGPTYEGAKPHNILSPLDNATCTYLHTNPGRRPNPRRGAHAAAATAEGCLEDDRQGKALAFVRGFRERFEIGCGGGEGRPGRGGGGGLLVMNAVHRHRVTGALPGCGLALSFGFRTVRLGFGLFLLHGLRQEP